MANPIKLTNTQVLKRLYRYMHPYRHKFFLNLVLAIILAILAPVRPYLIQLSIDKYIINSLWDGLVFITIVQIVYIIIESLLKFAFTYLSNWLGHTVVNDLRQEVYNNVIRLRLSFFDKTPVGTITTRTVNDIEAINEVFAQGLISIIADILTIIAIISFMLYSDWRLTLISLIVFPLLILATYFFKEAVKKSFTAVRNSVSELNAFVNERIGGMQIVQLFGAENREFSKFDDINKKHRNANIKAITAYAIFFPVVEIILAMAIGLLVWYGAVRMMDFEVSQGIIIAFIMYLNLLFRPLRMLADKFNTLQMGVIAGERVLALIDSKEMLQKNGTIVAEHLEGSIRFENIWFGYSPEIMVLKGISFDIPAGNTFAIVGPTGAGKSSIISILTRLYEINIGQIFIDDIDLHEYDIYSLRKRIAFVLQDVFLFEGTIFENIVMNDKRISQELVENICRQIGIDKMILNLPGGYNFKLGEGGNTLSQGQRQLISFARALIFNPDILILDEATASVDSESEIMIQLAIQVLVKNRTSLVIAHRLSTIRQADQIIVLKEGKIIEQGTHHSLLEIEGGTYKKMYEQ